MDMTQVGRLHYTSDASYAVLMSTLGLPIILPGIPGIPSIPGTPGTPPALLCFVPAQDITVIFPIANHHEERGLCHLSGGNVVLGTTVSR